MQIKYVGPYLTVVAGGITFTRNVPVEVSDEKLAMAMVTAKDHNGKPVFASMQSSFELTDAELEVATAPAT